jgi:hypothetical protein
MPQTKQSNSQFNHRPTIGQTGNRLTHLGRFSGSVRKAG